MKVKKTNIIEKLVGAMLPQPTYHYLSLYCYAKKISRSAILRNLICIWFESKKRSNESSENALIYEITGSIQTKWNSTKIIIGAVRNFTKRDFSNFINETRKQLQSKGLSSYHIETILKHIQKG